MDCRCRNSEMSLLRYDDLNDWEFIRAGMIRSTGADSVSPDVVPAFE